MIGKKQMLTGTEEQNNIYFALRVGRSTMVQRPPLPMRIYELCQVFGFFWVYWFIMYNLMKEFLLVVKENPSKK